MAVKLKVEKTKKLCRYATDGADVEKSGEIERMIALMFCSHLPVIKGSTEK